MGNGCWLEVAVRDLRLMDGSLYGGSWDCEEEIYCRPLILP